ncbi:MAG: methylenetetrahydrofolate reductase [NAD(P)H] [Deltaproteobacteria bacterium]|nr:methylenetetrahydrofolate reductase [NAD(P)H] [Deltaproteobacteria bacterium]MDZ4340960.1 methylenetetrahydrofolate reductase [NAD(P)H] [Candidatus Binatia bacterium]
MKIVDLYARPGLTLSVEFFAPKTDKGDENLFSEIELIKHVNPAYCSVTYGAGGSTRDKTVDLVGRIHRQCGLEVMGHLTVVGQSKAEARAVLDAFKQGGIENLLALGGDPPQGMTGDWRPHPDGFHYAAELVREAVARGGFSIAVAGFPEVHPRALSRESDLRFLKEKVEAGADVIITQLFFDNDYYYRYVDDVRRLGVKVPIVPGILPILSAPQVRRFTALCKAKIPPQLDAVLAKVEQDDAAAVEAGIDYATRQCEELIKFGVPGLHFYSLNKSHSFLAVCKNLGL